MDPEMYDNETIIIKTKEYVQETLKNAESGHDYYHIERVLGNSLKIAEQESKTSEVNILVVQLGALLHDIADHKFHGGDHTVGPRVARDFLTGLKLNTETIDHVCEIIDTISFKGSSEINKMRTLEGMIVQDGDRLDALGAIGIARAFAYGGFKNRKMYDPTEKPHLNMTWEEYKKNQGTTINHFYEKLLLVKDLMNTNAGKEIASKKHDYMETFLNTFLDEWKGN
jgi:uncharacterized protein